MKNETGYFEGFEEGKMFYQYWLPDSGVIKVYLIAIHGWATHSDRIAVPAKYFTEKGFAVYSFDLRGHWRNAGELKGYIVSMKHIQKDLELFYNIVAEDAKDKNIFLMGHSLGGLVVIKYALEHPELLGIMISSPWLGLAVKLSFGKKVAKAISPLMAKLAPKFQIENPIIQEDMTSDPEILKEHIEDPEKIGSMVTKTFVEINKTIKNVFKNVKNLNVSCLIMQAGDERLVSREKTEAFYEKIDFEDKKFILYEDFLHELWNEKERVKVYKDMEEWLNNHL